MTREPAQDAPSATETPEQPMSGSQDAPTSPGLSDALVDAYNKAYRDAVLIDHLGDEDATRAALAHVIQYVRQQERAEIEQLRYERRLLGAARMVLDLVAAGDPSRWDQVRKGAEDVAQRIVDEIGHPVTDEPALGPGYRAALEAVRTLHGKPRTERHGSGCIHCAILWPCPTYRLVSAALDGEEAGRA